MSSLTVPPVIAELPGGCILRRENCAPACEAAFDPLIALASVDETVAFLYK
jgi:hypothetical protein